MSSPTTVQSKNESTMATTDDGTSVPDGATTNPNNNNNNKRPLSETTSDGSVDTSINEKRRKRLEKNRLSARECRRRKKEATEQMQHEINLLEGENLRLRLQLQVRFTIDHQNIPYWWRFSPWRFFVFLEVDIFSSCLTLLFFCCAIKCLNPTISFCIPSRSGKKRRKLIFKSRIS